MMSGGMERLQNTVFQLIPIRSQDFATDATVFLRLLRFSHTQWKCLMSEKTASNAD